MKNTRITILAIFLTVSLLTACTNRQIGTVGGAAVGGLVGNAVTGGSAAGTVAGAVGGGLIGNAVSR